MATRTVEVSGDQIEVHADIGRGRVVRALLTIEDGVQGSNGKASAGAEGLDQWEKDFEAMCGLAPLNQHPADDSREAIYGPDPGDGQDAGEPRS